MPSPRFPIPQGTLDMLILQILSLEPAHGYGIAQRLEHVGKGDVLTTGMAQWKHTELCTMVCELSDTIIIVPTNEQEIAHVNDLSSVAAHITGLYPVVPHMSHPSDASGLRRSHLAAAVIAAYIQEVTSR